jgi:hypothetical protein
VVVAVAVWCYLAATVNPIPGDEDAARWRVATALPLGSTKAQVVTWLASEGVRADRIWTGADCCAQVYAEQPYSSWLGYSGDVQMEFYFDGDGRLVRRLVAIEIVSL